MVGVVPKVLLFSNFTYLADKGYGELCYCFIGLESTPIFYLFKSFLFYDDLYPEELNGRMFAF